MDLAFPPLPPRPQPPVTATPPHRRRRRARTALLVTTMVAATAVAGSAGVRSDSAWFRSLDKPRWYPPEAAFGVVRTALYASIAWSATRAIDRAPAAQQGGVAATLATNLALNAGWTWTFFRGQRPGLAVVEALAPDASTLALVRAVARHDRAAAAALVPYGAWTLVATALTEEIWYRNLR